MYCLPNSIRFPILLDTSIGVKRRLPAPRAYGLVFPQPAAPAAIPEGLWEDPYAVQCRDQSRAANRPSYAIDRLIDHFHTEYVSGRVLQEQSFPFEAHEEALRNMARESRFGRRIIATEMFDIQN